MPIAKAFFICLSLTVLPLATQARDLTDMTVEIATEKRGGEAKQEAFDQATEQATERLTRDLLGPEKAAKLWPGLKSKLLKSSTRYLLFIKGTPPVEDGGMTKITVTMRLAPDNLETLLREEGLLSSGTLKILPLIEIVDSAGAHYAWWVDSVEEAKPGAREDLFRKFYVQLERKFKSKSAFVLDPTSASFRMTVPAAYRTGLLSREDQMLLAQYLKADIVMTGKIAVERPRTENSDLKLNYEVQMWQAKTGRVVTDLQRAEPLVSDTPKVLQASLEQSAPKVADELATKLNDAVTSGSLSLNVVRLSVTGAMTFRQQSEFRRQLGQVREIKLLKERLFEPNRVVFEVETGVSGQELAKAVQRTQFSLYRVEIDGAQDDSLALSVKALSSSSAQ